MRNPGLYDLVASALIAALMISMAAVPSIPVPFLAAPITVQTFMVMLAGTIFGPRRAFLGLVVFLLLIAVGVPGLSGFRGGWQVFVGATGGYLIGWPFGALVVGLLTDRVLAGVSRPSMVQTALVGLANVVGGILVIYAFGIPVLAYHMEAPILTVTLGQGIFLPGDLIKVGAATVLGLEIRRRLVKAGLGTRTAA